MTDREQKLFDSLLGAEELYPHRDFKVSPGGRKGKIMDLEDFKTSFAEFCEKRGLGIDEIFYEDYFIADQKVMFDYENVEEVESGTLSCGVPWILYYAGGDWELPVYFFLYPDGKTGNPRMYVPTRGNVFHKGLKVAYGSLKEKMYSASEDEVEKEGLRSIIKDSDLSNGYSKSEIENVIKEFQNNDDAYSKLYDLLDYNTGWMKGEFEDRVEGILKS